MKTESCRYISRKTINSYSLRFENFHWISGTQAQTTRYTVKYVYGHIGNSNFDEFFNRSCLSMSSYLVEILSTERTDISKTHKSKLVNCQLNINVHENLKRKNQIKSNQMNNTHEPTNKTIYGLAFTINNQ